MKNSPSQPQPFLTELVYERTPGHAEAVVRVEIERRADGPFLVIDQGGHVTKLPATTGLLEDTARAVAHISAHALQAGLAQIGPRGWRMLERLMALEAAQVQPPRHAQLALAAA